MTISTQPSQEQRTWGEAQDRALRIAVMDLRRLLMCMMTDEKEEESQQHLTWQSLLGRAKLAQDLLYHIQRGYHDAVYKEEEQEMQRQDGIRLHELEEQVELACHMARKHAEQRKGTQVDLIHDIFHSYENKDEKVKTQSQEEMEKSKEASPPSSDETTSVMALPENKSRQRRSTQSQEIEELQKAQREQLEEEIAHMASRLKESTQRMNTTLRTQTEDLGEMEDLALKNVEKVTKVADDVTSHNKKAWRATFAKWSLIIMVLGSFCFCMVTIRMIPKQRGRCLIFCFKQTPEICNRIDDGSVICVDRDGNPYIKQKASVREEEDEENEIRPVEACEVGFNGECVMSSDTLKKEQQQESADGDEKVCNDKGECKAQLVSEDDDMSECQDGECKQQDNTVHEQFRAHARHDDEPDGKDNRQSPVRPRQENGSLEAVVQDASEETAVGEAGSLDGFDQEHPSPGPVSAPEEAPRMDVPLDFNDYDVRSAAQHGDVSLLKRYLYLMPRYASVPDDNGWQAIHEATRAGHTDCVDALLTDGRTDVNTRTGLLNDGYTPLRLAYNNGFDDSHDLVRLLKDHGGVSLGPNEQLPYKAKDEIPWDEFERFNLIDFHDACKEGDDIRVAQYIVAMTELIEEGDENNWRAIHETVRHGHRISTQLLINAGADINAPTGRDGNGFSPLAIALKVHGEDHPITHLLLRHGAIAVFPNEENQ